MSVTVIHRDRDLPPNTVDAFCTTCKGEVLVDERELCCPDCGTEVDPRSLPVVPSNGRQVAVKQQPAAQGQTKVLPPTKAARKWHAATDELLAEAEAEEAEAKLEFERAKERYEAAFKLARYIRQLRQVARVDTTPALPAPKPTTATGTKPRTHHIGRHAASGPCKGCPPVQETNDGN